MKIRQIHIENFGILNKIDLNLNDNANVLLRDNAWGKTTLAVFIKVMFYGFSHEQKSDEAINERLRYMPWQGGVYGGSLVFQVGSKSYRLSKTFGKKKSEDRSSIYDADTNLSTTEYSHEPGFELFGIDMDSFLRTMYVSGNVFDVSVTSAMQAKFGDISLLDRDIQNYDAVRERIKKEKDYLNPNRKTGLVQKKYRELSKLKASLSGKEWNETRLFDLKEEIVELEKKRAYLLEELHHLDTAALDTSDLPESDVSGDMMDEKDLNGLQDDSDMEDIEADTEEFKPSIFKKGMDYVLRTLHLDNVDPLEFLLTLRDEILDLFDEKVGDAGEFKKDYVVLFIIVFLSYLFSHIIWGDGIFRFGTILFMFVSSIFLTFLLYIVLRLTVYRKLDPGKYGKKVTSEEKEEKDKTSKDITNSSVNERGEANEKEHNAEPETKEGNTEESETKESDAKAKEELRLQMKTAFLQEETQIMETLLLLHQEETKLSEMIQESIRNEKDFHIIKKEYLQLKERYEILDLTESFLEQARISYTTKYMEPLKQGFDRYFKMFIDTWKSNNRQEISEEMDMVGADLVMDANLDIQIDTNGVLHSTRVLSAGYKDIINLCKRFALMELMYQKERPLIILDDPFVNLDDKKMKGAIQFLKKLSDEGQVLYFTCNRSRFPEW